MSDIRFNQWLHNSGTGGVSQVDGGHVGIGTTNPEIAVHSGNNKILNVGIVTASTYYGDGSNLTGITVTTINNNAANRIITGEGGTTLNGEANLTYDGTTLNIIDSGGGSGSHRLTVGNSHDLRLYHDGNSTIGHFGDGDLYLTSENGKDLYLRAADDIFIKPQGGENGITVTGNGSVALYHDNVPTFETLSTGAKVSVTSGQATLRITSADNYSGSLFLGPSSDYDAAQIWYDDYANGMYFRTSTNASMTFYTNGTQRMVLQNDGHLRPYVNDSYDLGTSSYRWRNVYTTDLQLSNKGKTNDVDGTWGDYTIQEGESDLFLINNRSGKKYKFNLTEVL